MSKKIEFPKNYQIYTSKALEHLQNNEYKQAIGFLRKAYAIKEEDSLNVLLVSALFQNGQVREAYDIAEDKKSFYESKERRLLVYVEILLANNNFLQAQKHIEMHLKKSQSTYKESWKKLDDELSLKRKEYGRDKKLKEEAIVKHLFSLASVSEEEQFKCMNDAEQLSTANLQKVAPSIFNNPYVHPFVKSSLLSLLIEREDSTCYSYTWFGKTKMLVPKGMKLFDETKRVQSLLKKNERFFSLDPSLKELVMSELKLILLSLYPFIDDVISEEKEEIWLLVIADLINGPLDNEYTVSESDKEYIQSWLQMIHEQMQ